MVHGVIARTEHQPISKRRGVPDFVAFAHKSRSLNRTIIHIGMARAASTFLQNRVFPLIRDFRYFGVETTQYSEPFQKLLYLDESLYRPRELLRSEAATEKANKLLSNELFAGQSLYLVSGNRTRTATRLKEIHPDAEIVLILRNQVSLLESLYALAVYAGHTQTPEEFIHFGHRSSVDSPAIPSFEAGEYLPSYRYSPLIKLYQDLFPKVNVFLFEDFKASPAQALEQWLSALDLTVTGEIDFTTKINPSLSSRKLGYIRRFNRIKPLLTATSVGAALFRKNIRFAEHGPLSGKRFRFDPLLTERVQREFHEDNKELLRLVPTLNEQTLNRHYLRG